MLKRGPEYKKIVQLKDQSPVGRDQVTSLYIVSLDPCCFTLPLLSSGSYSTRCWGLSGPRGQHCLWGAHYRCAFL